MKVYGLIWLISCILVTNALDYGESECYPEGADIPVTGTFEAGCEADPLYKVASCTLRRLNYEFICAATPETSGNPCLERVVINVVDNICQATVRDGQFDDESTWEMTIVTVDQDGNARVSKNSFGVSVYIPWFVEIYRWAISDICQTQNRNLSIGTFPTVSNVLLKGVFLVESPFFCNIADFFLLWPLSSLFSIILLRGQKELATLLYLIVFRCSKSKLLWLLLLEKSRIPLQLSFADLFILKMKALKSAGLLKNCKKDRRSFGQNPGSVAFRPQKKLSLSTFSDSSSSLQRNKF